MKRVLMLALWLVAHTAIAADYRWLNSWDRQSPQVPLLADPYMKAVEAASSGRIKFVVSGPESVPSFEQLQPVAAGAFHFLFTHGVYHFGTTPVLSVLDTLGGTAEQRLNSGIFDLVDKMYQRIGLKVLAVPFGAEGGYQLVIRQPLTAAGDLQGRKIRGNPAYASVIRLLGASVVTLPPGEIYTAMEKGVVDGFAYPTYGIIDARFNEVSKHLVRPAFGFGTIPILINLATWNKIEPRDQKILLDEARKAHHRWYDSTKTLIANEERELLANRGMTIANIAPPLAAKLHRAFADGSWEGAAQKSKKDIEELRAFAKAKGLD
jgi:TRAP-type transport system periplasmic protein